MPCPPVRTVPPRSPCRPVGRTLPIRGISWPDAAVCALSVVVPDLKYPDPVPRTSEIAHARAGRGRAPSSIRHLMRYAAFACDYDGTIARRGRVDDATIAALERVRQSGRRLILVTGRQLSDLQDCFTRIDLFD